MLCATRELRTVYISSQNTATFSSLGGARRITEDYKLSFRNILTMRHAFSKVCMSTVILALRGQSLLVHSLKECFHLHVVVSKCLIQKVK